MTTNVHLVAFSLINQELDAVSLVCVNKCTKPFVERLVFVVDTRVSSCLCGKKLQGCRMFVSLKHVNLLHVHYFVACS